jgi:tyrosyl-tRNA synthetase
LFSKDATEELKSLPTSLILEVFEGVPHVEIKRELYESCENYLELLQAKTEAGIFTSNSDARKMIQSGAISINKSKIADANDAVDCDLLQDQFILVQKGKKNYYLLEIVD